MKKAIAWVTWITWMGAKRWLVQLAALVVFTVSVCHAAVFSVSPVRIFLQPKDKATAITLSNEGATEVVLQADMFQWKQLPGGEDDLTLSEDLIVSPPIIKLAPGAKQVVRLARLDLMPPSEQLTYRLIVREIPEIAAVKPTNVSLQIALALSMPVFITPAAAKPAMQCDLPPMTASDWQQRLLGQDGLTFSCKNQGNAHAQVRHAWLMQDGRLIARLDNGGYFLAGTQRGMQLPKPQELGNLMKPGAEANSNIKTTAAPMPIQITAGTPGSKAVAGLYLSLDDGSEPFFPLMFKP